MIHTGKRRNTVAIDSRTWSCGTGGPSHARIGLLQRGIDLFRRQQSHGIIGIDHQHPLVTEPRVL